MPEILESPEKYMFNAYGIWLLDNKHRFVKQIKKNVSPSAHGDKHWDSSYLLMDYLEDEKVKKGTRVLDVGCGWGPSAIYLANRGCKVTGLDLDEDVFSFLEVQSVLNSVNITKRVGAMADMKKKDLEQFDLIVGGDICFWDELVDEWFKMLKRAASAGVKRVVMGDPGRSTFLELADKCELKWPTSMLPWYSHQPKRFEGYVLDVQLNE